ncbi:MAG: hypothetical protein L6R28_23250 [Planctomycetes bacterium]|nr:hypothetical protein [Planctomycetota bacterium]
MRTFLALMAVLALSVYGVSAAESSSSSSSSSGTSAGIGSGGGSSRGTTPGGLARSAGVPEGSGSQESLDMIGEDGAAMVGNYFLHRFFDLMDIIDFSLGAGPGFLVNVRATKLAQFGGGYSKSWRVGMRGRSVGFWKEKRTEAGISLLYYQKMERERITGWVESIRAEEMDLDTAEVYGGDKDRSFTGVGFTVHAGILVDVNVRPMQAADFVLGLFTIDVLEDDTGKLIRNKDL